MNDHERAELVRDVDALDGAGAEALTARDVVAVTGVDAGRYLQGQLSQEVVTLGRGESTWSLLLDPSGKVAAWVRVHRVTGDDYCLDVDEGWGDVVVARLRRFLLRTKAAVAEPERRLVRSRRHGPGRVEIGAVAPGPSGLSDTLVGVVAGPGVAGVDRLLPAGVAAAQATADATVVSPLAFERHRIAHGVPAMGAELTADTIPGEAGAWLVEASVSFTKGCYTGQELVARIDSRGNTVPRPIRLLRVEGGADPGPIGVAVVHDGAEVGHVTSVTPALDAEHPGLALAVVARRVEVGSTVTLGASGGPTAVVVDPSATV